MIACSQCSIEFAHDPALAVRCTMCNAAPKEYCTVHRGRVLRGVSHSTRQRAAIKGGRIPACPHGTPQSGRTHYFPPDAFPYAGKHIERDSQGRLRVPRLRRAVQEEMFG